MKILHIAPNAPYNDYWGYQDNLLPKYQKVLGHDVSVIGTNKVYQNGKLVEIQTCEYTPQFARTVPVHFFSILAA